MPNHRVFGDWGTSRLRLFLASGDDILDSREGAGIAVSDGDLAGQLRTALTGWTEQIDLASITLCGMVGSRNGWMEVPYAHCPADSDTWQAAAGRTALDGVPIAIMAGLDCTSPAGDPDVMRGEETQLFGAIALNPALAAGRHCLALPGTHCKWAIVEDGRITTFRTFLTGELFALLRDYSTLARLGGSMSSSMLDGNAGFQDGLIRAEHSNGFLGSLFSTRSAQILYNRSPSWGLGYLSGLLIGTEIAEALGDFDGDGTIRVIGDPALAERYGQALRHRGVTAELLDGNACVLAGLRLMESAA